MKQRTMDKTLRALRNKNDCRVDDGVIYLLSGNDHKHQKQNDLGNKSWGNIDYLIKEGYRTELTDSFKRRYEDNR